MTTESCPGQNDFDIVAQAQAIVEDEYKRINRTGFPEFAASLGRCIFRMFESYGRSSSCFAIGAAAVYPVFPPMT